MPFVVICFHRNRDRDRYRNRKEIGLGNEKRDVWRPAINDVASVLDKIDCALSVTDPIDPDPDPDPDLDDYIHVMRKSNTWSSGQDYLFRV